MNKNTKIRLNYLAGVVISLFLLRSIYRQVQVQLGGINADALTHTGPAVFLFLSIGLMFINTSLEGYKWHLLTKPVEVMKYSRAFASYLAGVALSIITPNRIGEYPGRILYLGRTNTFRYINVSVLGVMSQLSGVYILGLLGLVYYNIAFPTPYTVWGLVFCILANILLAVIYWRFESWLPLAERFRWLRRFSVYGRLLTRVTTRRQLLVLGISLLRCLIFTAQYLFLLRWMNVNVPLAEGFCMAALFFWVMAVIPSIALTELGIRGIVSIFLFKHFSDNTAGIVAASAGIWLLNLIITSVEGSILIIRMRLFR